MTLRSFVFACLWFALGAIAGIAGLIWLEQRPNAQTWQSDLAPRDYPSPLVHFDYALPSSMTVGEQADLRMHITNLAVQPIDKSGKPVPGWISVSLNIPQNCSAKANSPVRQTLAAVGQPIAFDWTIVATSPGDCAIDVKSIVGPYEKIDPLVLPVRERLGVAEIVALLTALILASPGLLNHFHKMPGTPKATRDRNRGSYV